MVEVVDDSADAGGEVLDAAAELVALASSARWAARLVRFSVISRWRTVAARRWNSVIVDQGGLVEVGQPTVLAAGCVELAVQAG